MAINVTSGFVGTNVANILSLLVLGAESIQKGLIHTIPSKYDDIFIPRIDTAADQLQARAATPSSPSDHDYTEKVISPTDMMFYSEFNPASFEHVWQDFWPGGAMVNQVLDPKIQAAITKTVAGSINTQLDKNIWQGDTTLTASDPLGFMDGFLKKLAADTDVIDVVLPAAALDATNIKTALDNMIDAMPAAVRVNKKPKFIMSHLTFSYFEQYAVDLDYKGSDIFNSTQPKYRGYDLVAVGGMAEDKIVFAVANSGLDSNLFSGTWMPNDKENFKIERLQANSELWFLKALFRYGIQYGYGQEIVYGVFSA